jgi:hypothetical protein
MLAHRSSPVVVWPEDLLVAVELAERLSAVRVTVAAMAVLVLYRVLALVVEEAAVATVVLPVTLEVTARMVAVGLVAPGMGLVVPVAGAESYRAPELVPARRTGSRVTKQVVRVVEVEPVPQPPIGTRVRSGRRVEAAAMVRPFFSIRWQVFLLVVVEVALEVVP